jgi:hypothetical protein
MRHASTCKVIESEWCLQVPEKSHAPQRVHGPAVALPRPVVSGIDSLLRGCINTINNKRDSKPIPTLHHAHYLPRKQTTGICRYTLCLTRNARLIRQEGSCHGGMSMRSKSHFCVKGSAPSNWEVEFE